MGLHVRGRCLARRLSIGPETIHFHGPMHTRRRGVDILHDPVWNKDLAFEGYERDRLGLRGLLPVSVQSIETQVQRILRELDQEPDDIHKNLFLTDLQNRNETLFNRVLVDNVRFCKGSSYHVLVALRFRWKRSHLWYTPQLLASCVSSSDSDSIAREECICRFQTPGS